MVGQTKPKLLRLVVYNNINTEFGSLEFLFGVGCGSGSPGLPSSAPAPVSRSLGLSVFQCGPSQDVPHYFKTNIHWSSQNCPQNEGGLNCGDNCEEGKDTYTYGVACWCLDWRLLYIFCYSIKTGPTFCKNIVHIKGKERNGKVKEFSYVEKTWALGDSIMAYSVVSLENPRWALRESYVRPSATILTDFSRKRISFFTF